MLSINGQEYIALRNPLVQIEDFDEGNVRLGTITTEFRTYGTGIYDGYFVKFNDVDLSNVKTLAYSVQQRGAGGTIEVRLNSKDGRLVSALRIPAGNDQTQRPDWKEFRAKMNSDVKGEYDVYFVFTNPEDKRKNLFNIDWIYFDNK